ncbi:MAG: hypothetical protein Q7S70_02965, partial [bacterium]|nr:hypothetical protein [bacterium]
MAKSFSRVIFSIIFTVSAFLWPRPFVFAEEPVNADVVQSEPSDPVKERQQLEDELKELEDALKKIDQDITKTE